ncbi:unnamed protein product, partial [Choristocarpus tenellus]
QIVLTKADLLNPEDLSSCVRLLREDLQSFPGLVETVPVVCGTAGAGVTALWQELEK